MTTIKDVAREAGVSVATVSRVFNGSGPVSDVTRKRIEAVAATLRYVPHGGARSLITNRTSTVGVLLPHLYGEFFSEVIRGMDQAAQRHGYHLLLSSSHDDRAEIESAMRAMRGRVDGLLVMSPHVDSSALVANVPPRLPVMLLNSGSAVRDVDTLSIDNEAGARLVVRHLIELGHRRIAIIRGADDNFDAAERVRGYRRALQQAGIPAEPSLEIGGDFTEASGHQAAMTLFAGDFTPTAIFASNDSMAFGAMSALRELGRSVPRDVAVAGFDDIPLARFMNPPLTTVHVAIAELGARGVETLVRAIARGERHVPGHNRLETTLVVRQSCGSR
ncbi:MAG TPA: LacI family DNA-binding transcriptional regulator [Gemmatimonadaceae bacterium]|nr:LacI family DNA-binding transcriptional regulator [Gemmatimonadaceae bacterium]